MQVCDKCGSPTNTCNHMYDADYTLEDAIDYAHGIVLLRRTCAGMLIALALAIGYFSRKLIFLLDLSPNG